MRIVLRRFGAVLAVTMSALLVALPAFAGGDHMPVQAYGHAPMMHAHPAPMHVEPHHSGFEHGGYEQGLRKRGHYWTRPRVHKIVDKEVVPSCYMKRERIWLDRYTYTHKYHRHCD